MRKCPFGEGARGASPPSLLSLSPGAAGIWRAREKTFARLFSPLLPFFLFFSSPDLKRIDNRFCCWLLLGYWHRAVHHPPSSSFFPLFPPSWSMRRLRWSLFSASGGSDRYTWAPTRILASFFPFPFPSTKVIEMGCVILSPGLKEGKMTSQLPSCDPLPFFPPPPSPPLFTRKIETAGLLWSRERDGKKENLWQVRFHHTLFPFPLPFFFPLLSFFRTRALADRQHPLSKTITEGGKKSIVRLRHSPLPPSFPPPSPPPSHEKLQEKNWILRNGELNCVTFLFFSPSFFSPPPLSFQADRGNLRVEGIRRDSIVPPPPPFFLPLP